MTEPSDTGGHQPFRAHSDHEWARRVLAAEEPIVASCVVDYNGTLPPSHAREDAAIAGVGPGAHMGPPDPVSLVAFPVATRMAIVLTPTRVLVFGVGFTGTPKKFLGAVPLASVSEIRQHDGVHGEQMSVVMRSGAVVDLERRDGDPASVIVARLADLRTV